MERRDTGNVPVLAIFNGMAACPENPKSREASLTATIQQFTPTPAQTDGGRSRLLRKHPGFTARNLAEPICDLTMGRADPEDTAPCEYQAAAYDGA